MSNDRYAPDGFAELEAIANDPARLADFKAECIAKARREMPWMSEAQLESHWRYAASLFF